jgi:hypothetical protein
MTAGATRSRHFLRQMALLVILGRPPRYAITLAQGHRRSIDNTLDELSRRRRRAQITARHALQI